MKQDNCTEQEPWATADKVLAVTYAVGLVVVLLAVFFWLP